MSDWELLREALNQPKDDYALRMVWNEALDRLQASAEASERVSDREASEVHGGIYQDPGAKQQDIARATLSDPPTDDREG